MMLPLLAPSTGLHAHLGGFIHGAGEDERAVPVQLDVGDLTAVAHQGVDTSEGKTHTHVW